MEWSKLGELLGSSLSGGLNTVGDIALQRRAQQQAFEHKKQFMLEQEAAKERALQAKEAERRKKSEIFGALVSGRNPFQEQVVPNQGQMPDMSAIGSQEGIIPQSMTSQREPSIDELTAAAVEAGLGPQEIGVLQRNYEKKKANDLAERKFKWQMDKAEQDRIADEEKPQRTALTARLADAKEKSNAFKKLEHDYKLLEQVVRQGKVRQGTPYQIMSKLGIAEWGQNPESELASKLIENISLAQTQTMTNIGNWTNQKLESLYRSNPNRFMSPRGLLSASRANRLTVKADRLYNDKLLEMEDKYIKDKKPIPLNIESMARNAVKDKVEQIHKKQSDIVFTLGLENPMKLKGEYTYNPETRRIYKSDGKEWVFEGTYEGD